MVGNYNTKCMLRAYDRASVREAPISLRFGNSLCDSATEYGEEGRDPRGVINAVHDHPTILGAVKTLPVLTMSMSSPNYFP